MTTVILKRGKGKKKKYNGSKANLVGRNGGWIDAKLVADGTIVKWRGKSFDSVLVASTTSDASPITLDTMPSDVMSYILSFLFSSGGDPNDVGWDVVAPTLNSILRVNSQLTQKLTATVFLKTSFCANLLHLRGHEVFSILVGLAACPFAFQSIQITAGYDDFGFLASLFLHHFNMTKIETLTVKPSHAFGGRRILRPRLARPIEVDIDVPYEEPAADIFPIPPACRNMSATTFQNNVIGTFHTLKNLRLYVIGFEIFNNDQNFMLQLPILCKLDLAVRFHHYEDNNGASYASLAKFISKMHMEHFVFRGATDYYTGKPTQSGADAFSNYFVLESSTLRTFSQPGFNMKGCFVRKCVCPKLERFTCKGYVYGNGVRPNDPLFISENWQMMLDFPRGQSEFLVADQPFYGMEVPPTCVVAFDN